jgi:hypothetical protein
VGLLAGGFGSSIELQQYVGDGYFVSLRSLGQIDYR